MNKTSVQIAIVAVAVIVGGAIYFSAPKTENVDDQSAAIILSTDPKIQRLYPYEFTAYLQSGDVTVIDIRTPEEFDGGHIENAVNLDFYSPEFKDNLSTLDKNKKYAIYCRSGARSEETLTIMKDLGFMDVADLIGGLESIQQ
ncbi:MAG: rhodanese-like domain-containing protein [Candidatus Paceibacterota bacterium]|jgi:rhodanese-related sulfurtransferase